MIISFNYFEIEIPIEVLQKCYHSGECIDDVKENLHLVDFSKISDDNLNKELKDTGAWDDNENRAMNEIRILWLAAGNYADEIYDKDLAIY